MSCPDFASTCCWIFEKDIYFEAREHSMHAHIRHFNHSKMSDLQFTMKTLSNYQYCSKHDRRKCRIHNFCRVYLWLNKSFNYTELCDSSLCDAESFRQCKHFFQEFHPCLSTGALITCFLKTALDCKEAIILFITNSHTRQVQKTVNNGDRRYAM